MNFKIGDRVRLVNDTIWGPCFKGAIGVVVNTPDSGKGRKLSDGNITILLEGRKNPQIWFANFWEKIS